MSEVRNRMKKKKKTRILHTYNLFISYPIMKLYPNNFFFRNATSEENVQYDLKKRAEITDCCLLR